MTWNQRLFMYIHSFAGRSPIFDGIAIFLAEYLIYFLVIGFILFVLAEQGTRRKFYWLIEGVLTVILARGIIAEIIYRLYDHARPFVYYSFASLVAESGPSFPSGHAIIIFALAIVLWYMNRKLGLLYFLFGFVVGVARIYAGVHWPLDIIGAFVIAVLCGMIIHRLCKSSREALYQERS